ncbi:MAG: 2-hydroxyglutaryl-CoA dehydratase [Candidatus Riflebacteria bacterium RBG_13_59_9]|nr:MAG: 2-hydroxyglutaryl-CoA dehydratase [Candidatus Riflebacteria bacterium RBG_13_59_9]
MRECYLGADIGSISTKAVVVNDAAEIIAASYQWTEGDPIRAVKRVAAEIEGQTRGNGIDIVACGATGSARHLSGLMLNATLVKNEITAHAIGTLSRYPQVQTIFEIGGQDSKIIILRSGVVVDYAMNTLCAAGTGAFLSSQARRLGIEIQELGSLALKSTKPARIAGRCTVFSESDLIHKANMGYSKEDLVAGLCRAIVHNYLNNVTKGKDIQPPIVFQGGVSLNAGVVQAVEEITGYDVLVDENAHVMGAIGVAILAGKSSVRRRFSYDVLEISFKTSGYECPGCQNACEMVCTFRNDEFLDAWGNRCENGSANAQAAFS